VAGGYADWEAKRALKSEAAPRPKPAAAPQASPPPPVRKGKLTYKDQRDYDLLPARIEALDAAILRDEAALHDPALYTRDPQRFGELTAAVTAARAEKAAAEERWLTLAELVEG
jgi:ATP-binding cassette subfamily F protein uup